jgi:triacylglycerol lipase
MSPLYPGVSIVRDQNFGPDPEDLVDIFYADQGGKNRTVLIYVSGGGGNKIEQQDREANVFYDNIGRWATKNGMVGVTMQRHPGAGNWDDGGRDISRAVDWVQANIEKYHGNPNRIFMWTHSAGNWPTGIYIGHPDHWAHGVAVKGAILMSGDPVPGMVPPPPPGGPNPLFFPSTCGAGGPMSADGTIAGPSGAKPGAPGFILPAPRQLTPEQIAERNNLPGFQKTGVKILLARAEWDPGATGGMMPSDKAIHDEMCKLDSPNAKDGVGHCPVMLFLKGESHMSEVFSIDTADQTVSGPLLEFIKSVN